jgi:hypothetical protein
MNGTAQAQIGTLLHPVSQEPDPGLCRKHRANILCDAVNNTVDYFLQNRYL